MSLYNELDKIGISVKSKKLLRQLLVEHPFLEEIYRKSKTCEEACQRIRTIVENELKRNPEAYRYYRREIFGKNAFDKLKWKDVAAIRILDYLDYEGTKFTDLNLSGRKAISSPFKMIWLATKFGTSGANSHFFSDILYLFRQFSGKMSRKVPSKDEVIDWMDKFASGLDNKIVAVRKENRDRILTAIINKIDKKEIKSSKYFFTEEQSFEDKLKTAKKWWEQASFHLKFAVRDLNTLNEYLGYSLTKETIKNLKEAEEKKIPIFINPYYLSLFLIKEPYETIGSDLAIKQYIIYSKELVEEFGNIVAWEKEDKVEIGKPNAAGWILPSRNNVHRRYPEVAILIPKTVGRACAGLCASCQRMYGFQSGNLNFNLEELKPSEKWNENLKTYLEYFENDSQLRDMLITGGDALMSSNNSLKEIFDEVLKMAVRKIDKNKLKAEGEKFAEIKRIRLGTRLLAYLPQRVDNELTKILNDFRQKAQEIGIEQFIIQAHFEAPLEITSETKKAVKLLQNAGWVIVNQLVFTAAASRRGHTAKLRKVLNDIGILTYYTFSVKGYKENYHNFATNTRIVQEQYEEKVFGLIPEKYNSDLKKITEKPLEISSNIDKIRNEASLPFLATDRSVLNLPGVGKSLTFRTIGITRYGRRILEFDHDANRNHSPIIHKLGKVRIIESKPIGEYFKQLTEMGENIADYESIWGYSLGETEPPFSVFEYPKYKFKITKKLTNNEV